MRAFSEQITQKRLREHFSLNGELTDVKMLFNKETGAFRNMAFIGFKFPEQADEAIKYFNNSFIDTCKVCVEICSELNSSNKPRSRSKYAKESNSVKMKQSCDDEIERTVRVEKQRINPFDEIKDDPSFKEFLKAQRNIESGKGKQIWSDDVTPANHLNIDDGNEKEVENSVTNVKNKKNKEKKEKLTYEYEIKLSDLPYKVKKSEIREFLSPLQPISLRQPLKGIAFVAFNTIKELKQALNKHKGFIRDHQIQVKQHKTKKEQTAIKGEQKWITKPEETVAESGRIFMRNLPYTVTEEELQNLFSKYGPVTELHLPIDSFTKKLKGIGFVTFMFPEHAVQAFSELDGSSIQGRLLHLIPAQTKPDKPSDAPPPDTTSYKKKKDEEKKSEAGNAYNWNSLFLGANAVADVMSDKFNVKKSSLLTETKKGDSLAVRMALGETQIVNETRKFLLRQKVDLDVFSRQPQKSSKNVILVKNLPAKTTEQEITELFNKFGLVSKVILPPYGVSCIVEMQEPSEARTSFRKLAYSNFKHYPLYLEWAPANVFREDINLDEENDDEANDALKTSSQEGDNNNRFSDKNQEELEKNVDSDEASDKEENNEESEPEEGATLFVKNLNFDTDETSLRNHFRKCGRILSTKIATKMTSDRGMLSMGFGFVQFKKKHSAQKALKEMQHSMLDNHTLELKISNKTQYVHVLYAQHVCVNDSHNANGKRHNPIFAHLFLD